MSRFDEAGQGLSKPIGLPTKEENTAMKIQKRKEAARGRAYRVAKRAGDLQGILAAEAAGYTDRGIVNVSDKEQLWGQKSFDRRKDGDLVVGGQQRAAGEAGGDPLTPSDAGASRDPNGTQPLSPRLSFADQDKMAGKKSALSGAFGKAAQAEAEGKPYDATPGYDTIAEARKKFLGVIDSNKGEDGFSDKFEEQARKQGAALGLSSEQIDATLEGYRGDDLSPEAIAGRSKDRKDEASKKREGGTRIIPWEERLQMEEKERLDAAQRGESGKPYGFEELDNKLDEISRKAGVAAEKGRASVERTKNVLNDVNVKANRTTANSGVIRPSDNRPSLNQFMESLDGPIAGNNKESPLIPTEKPNNETIKGEVVRPDRVWGEGLGSDAVNTISATGQVLGGWAKNIWRGAEIGSKFTSDAAVEIDDSRRSDGARAMDFADKVGGYLTGKKEKPKANDPAPKASINRVEIKGKYDKASRAGDNILYGL